MRWFAMLSGVVAAISLVPSAASQQLRPWWIAAEFGEGQLKISSDQAKGNRDATFALGFAGGSQLGNKVRLGLHVNGWLLQAFNLNDPTVGESVSNVSGILDFFPLRDGRGFFARGGLGYGNYTNDRPSGENGSGLAWETGAGYEIPLRGPSSLVPSLEYSAGHLGDAQIPGAEETGRRFSVVEFKVSLLYHFGRPRQSRH
jgi:hypothetical protein